MPVYMSQFAYTTEAWAALTKNPVDRREAVRGLMQNVGGRLIELYYGFGEYDGVLLFEAPDDTSASAGLLAALAPGHIKAIKTTKLLTVEETLEALRKAGSISYRAPSATR
jgi:uncharacterized protein with GYD domain